MIADPLGLTARQPQPSVGFRGAVLRSERARTDRSWAHSSTTGPIQVVSSWSDHTTNMVRRP